MHLIRNKDSMKCAGFENVLSSGGFSGQGGGGSHRYVIFCAMGKKKLFYLKVQE
jgi:hypothetical protein